MSRFLIACGGTGGHLAPGIALAEGLNARGAETMLLISHKQVDARLIGKYPQIRFERIPGAPFALGPARLARFLWRQTQAFFTSARLIRSWRPDVIVGFGGFTTAGIIVVAALHRRPVALHEANRVPGRAIRLLGGLARRLYLPPGVHLRGVRAARVRHVGLPVRREIVRRPREDAQRQLGFDPAQKLLAILGGSQGASALNDWARAHRAGLAGEGIQVCCVTGLGKGGDEGAALPAPSGRTARSVFLPFCDDMATLLSAADLVVARAGAGTLAELVCCETPALLIPYPHAADNHQRANATYFEQQGGGVVVGEPALGGLRQEVLDVIFNDWLLNKFRGNLRRMAQENSIETIVHDLENLAAGTLPAGHLPAAPAASPV